MTKQKWILLSLCIGILWGTDTLIIGMWSENRAANTISEQQGLAFEKVEGPLERKVKSKTQIDRQRKSVKLAYKDSGIQVQKNIKSPSPSAKKLKAKDLDKVAKAYDKKLTEKKKVPQKKEDSNKDNNRNQWVNEPALKSKYSNPSNKKGFDLKEEESSEVVGSVIFPKNESQLNTVGSQGSSFTRGGSKTANQWAQTLTLEPTESDLNEFITSFRNGEIEASKAYSIVEELLKTDKTSNHSNAVRILMSVKSDKSFMFLTEVASGGFSEDVESTAYSGLLSYRSYEDLNIMETVLRQEGSSLVSIYFSAETVLQLSQQRVSTYGEGEKRSLTLLEAYPERFALLSDLLKQVATEISDERVLTQVNQTVAFIGNPTSVADRAIVKPSGPRVF